MLFEAPCSPAQFYATTLLHVELSNKSPTERALPDEPKACYSAKRRNREVVIGIMRARPTTAIVDFSPAAKNRYFRSVSGGARIRLRASAVAVLLSFVAGAASARPFSVDPMDWLIQHICADSADQPIAADPFGGCRGGLRERRLRLDDPMPYLRHDQPGKDGDHPHGFQRLASHPIIDVHTHATVAANDFDFDYIEPYGSMHPGDGDGFDVYQVADGYISGTGTRDGSGYSQTFFGRDCKPYGAWVFFPVSFLQSLASGAAGRGVFPIRGAYWEQNGEPWPGKCRPDEGYSWDTLTTWEFAPAHPFGGINGAAIKHIDAILSTHGLPIKRGPRARFHLERFYFTDLYGLTRWEAWAPSSEGVKASENCAGDTQMTYEGFFFILVDCRDWSVVQLIDPPKPRWPWPYPESNLLRNWHFDYDGIAPWQRMEARGGLRNVIKLGQFVSKAPADLRFSQTHTGVRYLQIGCSTEPCTPGEALYQDIPVAILPPSTRYDYGFSGVIDDTQNGMVEVRLSELDRNGEQLWSTSFDAMVKPDYRGIKAANSVYKASSVFLNASPPVTLKASAVALRFSLSPRTPVVYDILDAWLMPR